MAGKQEFEKRIGPMSKKQIFLNNFLGGFAWGIGSAIGAILLVIVLGYLLAKINIIPYVGSFTADIVRSVEQQNQPAPTPTGY